MEGPVHAPNPLQQTESGQKARSLVVRHLDKEYVRGMPVLKDINIEINGRGMTAIIGPSGTGKSTLIRCINRLVEPTRGEILLDGQDIVGLHGRALREARRRIGMVFQEFNLVERLTVIENLLCGRLGYVHPFPAWLRRFPADDVAQAYDLLNVVGLTEFAMQRADSLSGGQRQRVGIARAVMQQPRILLADEPTSSLDPKTSVEIMELMTQLAGRHDIPVVVNIHDVQLGRRFAQRVIGMSGGRIVFDGPPADIKDEHLKLIYGGENWLQ